MNVFHEFRHWARNASSGERAASALAAVVAVALIAMLLVPDHPDDAAVASAGGAVPSSTGAAGLAPSADGGANGTASDAAAGATAGGGNDSPTAGDAPAAPTPASSSDAPAAGSAGSGAASATCTSPPGAAPGLTATQMNVAVTMVDIGGAAANSLFGIASADEQQRIYQAVIDATNAKGGVACRKVVAKYYRVNPTDQSDMQAKCLAVAAAGVYLDIDAGGFANFPQKKCFAQHHLPYFSNNLLFASEQRDSYPYLFALGLYDDVYRNTAFALRDRGFFDRAKGFQKLGFIYRTCDKQIVESMKGWLRGSGVPDASLVTYDAGCPEAFVSPADLQQAVLKFKTSGVTHVTTVNFLADMANFTKIAQQQGFKPTYGLADDQLIAISYGNLRPDPANIDGAIAVTAFRNGEERTPGMAPTAGTVACNEILRKAGLPPAYASLAGSGGFACNLLWMVKATVEHSPSVEPSALAAGLQRTKSVDFSFPTGPSDFSGARVTTGGQFWRVAQYTRQCECWRLVDREFHPRIAG